MTTGYLYLQYDADLNNVENKQRNIIGITRTLISDKPNYEYYAVAEWTNISDFELEKNMFKCLTASYQWRNRIHEFNEHREGIKAKDLWEICLKHINGYRLINIQKKSIFDEQKYEIYRNSIIALKPYQFECCEKVCKFFNNADFATIRLFPNTEKYVIILQLMFNFKGSVSVVFSDAELAEFKANYDELIQRRSNFSLTTYNELPDSDYIIYVNPNNRFSDIRSKKVLYVEEESQSGKFSVIYNFDYYKAVNANVLLNMEIYCCINKVTNFYATIIKNAISTGNNKIVTYHNGSAMNFRNAENLLNTMNMFESKYVEVEHCVAFSVTDTKDLVRKLEQCPKNKIMIVSLFGVIIEGLEHNACLLDAKMTYKEITQIIGYLTKPMTKSGTMSFIVPVENKDNEYLADIINVLDKEGKIELKCGSYGDFNEDNKLIAYEINTKFGMQADDDDDEETKSNSIELIRGNWEKNFRQIKDFFEKNGRLPLQSENRPMYIWTQNQKFNYKHDTGSMSTKKNMDQRLRWESWMKENNIPLNKNTTSQTFRLKWNKKMKKFEDFIMKEQRFPDSRQDPDLYSWYKNQVSNYKLMVNSMKPDDDRREIWKDFIEKNKNVLSSA